MSGRCFRRGCSRPAIEYTAAWVSDWDDAGEEVRRRVEAGFCSDHISAAKATAVIERVAELIGPNERMYHWTLASFPADDPIGAAAREQALGWLKHRDGNLLIDGPIGSGKTSLGFSCARAVVEDEPETEVRFVNVPLLVGDLLRSRFRTDPSEDLIDADLLVLDDLGAERVIDATRDVLARIVYARHAAERPTIVTSNVTPSELAERLGQDDPLIGQRIVSRLVEDALRIRLDRPDLRLRSSEALKLDATPPTSPRSTGLNLVGGGGAE